MLSVFKNLFSGETIAQGADKLVLTNEEKLDNFNVLLKLYEPFKLAQRYLALVVVLPWSLACFITFFASFFTNVTQQIEMLSGDWGTASGVILLFYFGGGAARSIFGNGKS